MRQHDSQKIDKKLSVHIAEKAAPEFSSQLRSLIDASISLRFSEELPEPEGCDIFISGRVDSEWLKAASRLKAVIIPWAGVPYPTAVTLRQFPNLAVHNLHHNAASTAEHTLALMFAAARHIVPTDRKLRENDWRPRLNDESQMNLAGKSALVIGFGEIGQRIARVLVALNMHVTAINNSGKNRTELDVRTLTQDHLMQVLPQTNVLIACVPLTDKTKGMFGSEQLAALPDGAIVVNISRGGLIDETALYSALKSGRLYAGIDVWYGYPKDEAAYENTAPSQFDFGELDNVVMTPHIGGNAAGIETLRAQALAEMLNAFVGGKPMPNKVDIQQGY